MAKGRDKQLIRERNEALCRRYYYWTEAQSVRFDRALKILSKEFFLSEERIMAIIRERSKARSGYPPGPQSPCAPFNLQTAFPVHGRCRLSNSADSSR